MDLTVDPCDDFYRFSCGKFLRETQIPDDKTAQTTFKNLYKACMNVKNIETIGLDPMKKMLQDLGGWPVLEGENWNEETFSWKDSVYKFHEHGYSVDYFIDFSIVINVKNNTERIIDLDQATLGLSREYLVKGINEKLVNAYYRYMIDIAVILGANKDVATAELRDALEFEIKLANISLPLEQRRNASKLYNPMTLDDLQTKFPSIPWVEYLNSLLYPKDKLRETDIVVVDVPSYISNLEELLRSTPKKVQANYALWRATAAGILQGSFFSNDRPKYMNFGAIGFVIGHEITHGFDDQGRQFDKNGNLVDWWQEDTKKSYIEKAKCIIEQYGSYRVAEVNLTLNGINNQGENIADNGGIKEAYNAYVNWARKHPAEPRLPGLQEFTPQQMFWVSAASTWCSKHRPESLKLRITTGFHSPGEFRVLGPLSNLETFSSDFQCPSGSKMNPDKKCKVW
ncbi:hypothetical protein WDU94_007000 [Cyamophila willieti]